MPVSDVAGSSPATSAWANSVADSIQEMEADLYPGVYGQLAIPWASVTGKPLTFAPTLGPAVASGTSYGQSAAPGSSVAAAHEDHAHGTPALPTAAQVGAPAAYNTPATLAGGKRLYVGTATPTGPAEGDIWVKG